MGPTMLDGIRYFKCRGVCQGPAPFSTYTCYDLPEGLSMIQCLDCLFVTVAMDDQALKRKPRTLEGEYKQWIKTLADALDVGNGQKRHTVIVVLA